MTLGKASPGTPPYDSAIYTISPSSSALLTIIRHRQHWKADTAPSRQRSSRIFGRPPKMPRHSAPFTTTAWALGPNEPRTHCAPSTTRSRKPRQLSTNFGVASRLHAPAWAGLSKGTAPLRKGRSRVFHQGVDSTPAPSNAARLPHCAGMERGAGQLWARFSTATGAQNCHGAALLELTI